MQSDYRFNPRGVIKWQAFAAVVSGEEQKEEIKDIPILNYNLLDDYLDQLDVKIQEAILIKAKVKVKFLKNNQINLHKGYIKMIDYNSKQVIFSDIKIDSNEIIELDLIEDE